MPIFKPVRNATFGVVLALGAIHFAVPLHWVFYAVPIFFFVSFVAIGSSVLSLNVFVPALTSPTVSDRQIAITFDDGPTPSTLEVLAVLKKYRAKATFFCIGKRIAEHAEILQQILDEGHTIGNHSYSHSYFFSIFSAKKIMEEIAMTNRLIEQIAGKKNTLFRPPYGVSNPPIAKAVEGTGLAVIGWNLRSFDTTTQDFEKVIARIIPQIKPGTVLLLHDDRPNTPKILEAVLEHAQKEQYECVDIKRIFGIN
jgi:peptidoglycan-N-acetylglucosamine deacetylase